MDGVSGFGFALEGDSGFAMARVLISVFAFGLDGTGGFALGVTRACNFSSVLGGVGGFALAFVFVFAFTSGSDGDGGFNLVSGRARVLAGDAGRTCNFATGFDGSGGFTLGLAGAGALVSVLVSEAVFAAERFIAGALSVWSFGFATGLLAVGGTGLGLAGTGSFLTATAFVCAGVNGFVGEVLALACGGGGVFSDGRSGSRSGARATTSTSMVGGRSSDGSRKKPTRP
ncbi:MAG: hypothetical protein QF521_00185 [Alphaproteobacteria bacterium]|nr:hypothetical protein [Alphaproteobacteria bacterium]